MTQLALLFISSLLSTTSSNENFPYFKSNNSNAKIFNEISGPDDYKSAGRIGRKLKRRKCSGRDRAKQRKREKEKCSSSRKESAMSGKKMCSKKKKRKSRSKGSS